MADSNTKSVTDDAAGNGGLIGRVRHLMQVRHLSQRQLAKLLRLDPSNLSKVINGKLPFSEGLVNRMVADLGVSKRWLRDGEGLPFDKPQLARELSQTDGSAIGLSCAAEGVPVYDLDVTAGCRNLEDIFGHINPVGTLNLPGIASGSSVVKVSGDSMAPRIANGGYIAIRPISDLRNIFWGQIYVVELPDYRMVKYLRRHHDASMVILHSENPDYDDMDVMRSDIRSLYLVEAILNFEIS